MKRYLLLGLSALVLSTVSMAREVIDPDLEIKVYDHYLIKLGDHPGCGFDHLSFADKLCVKQDMECINNDFPAFMYRQQDKERFLIIDEKQLQVHYMHLDRLIPVGSMVLMEEGEVVVRENNQENCRVTNPYRRYMLVLNDNVTNLKITKDSFKKRVVNSGAVSRNKYLFETLEIKFKLGNDRVKILAMDGDPADWPVPEARNYTIEENRLNGSNDRPDYGYFDYFFNRHRR